MDSALMKRKFKKTLFALSVLLMFFIGAMGQDVCLSDKEISLANSINKLRQQNDLEPVKLSLSLSYVADVHTKDLYFHFDPYGACGLYLWSDEGRWAPCCPAGDEEDLECMYDKPHELTGYRSKGYEAVYYNNKKTTVDQIFKYWKSDSAVLNLMLEKGIYEGDKWNALGVSVFEGYASLWVGQLIDRRGEPSLCSNAHTANSDQSSAEKEVVPFYYIFVKSYKSRSYAEQKLTQLKNQNYKGKILPNNSRYRVALGPYRGYSNAKRIKNTLSSGYEDAWIQKAEQ